MPLATLDPKQLTFAKGWHEWWFAVAPDEQHVIVDSGRYLHQVSPVIGPKKRWTVCSFMALNRDKGAMYCWG